MRNGQLVIDTDTHLQPAAETILPLLEGEYRERRPEFEQRLAPIKIGRAGQILPEPYRNRVRLGSGGEGGGWAGNGPRILGQAGKASEERTFQSFMGSRYPLVGTEDYDVDGRIREMDDEGVDVEIMVPSAFGGHDDPDVDMAFIRALHRHLDEFCGHYPDRLKSIIQVSARAVDQSVEEMKRCADSSWAVAVQVNMPYGLPFDHPDLEPIWRQAAEQDLCVVHHSGSSNYPGEHDLWDNPFLGRLSSHPWGAMRAVASFMGAGIMDRYPTIRLAILESGFGWLPFWGKRMDDQVHYMGYVNPDLKHTMWEHLTGGRFFAGIVIHEGEEMAQIVNQTMGDGILMFGSDYPHAESRFPDSVDIVADWNLGAESKRKLFLENAARCFRVDATALQKIVTEAQTGA
jgi:predicted TIM-barrel fold metal-dependent hydrolase